MSKILVKYSDNYADEFNVKGFAIMSEKDFKKGMELAKKGFEEDKDFMTFVFGSNEYIEYEDFEEFENAFCCEKISENELITLEKYFGVKYGLFPNWIFEEEEW